MARSAVAAPTVQYAKLAAGPDIFAFSLSRDAWPDVGHVVQVFIDISLDGGLTWASEADRSKPWPWGQFPLSFGASGGDAVAPDSNISVASGVSNFDLPDAKNTSRVVRITITPEAEITTKADLLVSVKQ